MTSTLLRKALSFCSPIDAVGDRLNSNCYVSRDVRQDIEDTLLLPISEIEARKQSNAKHQNYC